MWQNSQVHAQIVRQIIKYLLPWSTFQTLLAARHGGFTTIGIIIGHSACLPKQLPKFELLTCNKEAQEQDLLFCHKIGIHFRGSPRGDHFNWNWRLMLSGCYWMAPTRWKSVPHQILCPEASTNLEPPYQNTNSCKIISTLLLVNNGELLIW